MNCAECDKPLLGCRADARYCSPACRQRAYRIRNATTVTGTGPAPTASRNTPPVTGSSPQPTPVSVTPPPVTDSGLDWNTIPGNQREKVKAAAAREAARQVKEWRRDADEKLKAIKAKYFADTLAADRKAQEQLKRDREALNKGFWTPDEYNVIRSCLHPDSRLSVSDEKLAEAFRLFNEDRVRTLLVKEVTGEKRRR